MYATKSCHTIQLLGRERKATCSPSHISQVKHIHISLHPYLCTANREIFSATRNLSTGTAPKLMSIRNASRFQHTHTLETGLAIIDEKYFVPEKLSVRPANTSSITLLTSFLHKHLSKGHLLTVLCSRTTDSQVQSHPWHTFQHFQHQSLSTKSYTMLHSWERGKIFHNRNGFREEKLVSASQLRLMSLLLKQVTVLSSCS